MRAKLIALGLGLAVLSLGAQPSPSHARPGEFPADAQIDILTGVHNSCTTRGAVCWSAGDSSTEEVASPEPNDAVSFARTAAWHRQAPHGLASSDPTPWVLRLDAKLQQPALAGNALFIFYDAKEPGAESRRAVTALLQTAVPAKDTLSARLSLSGEDGFQPGHTYRVVIAQIINGKEITLARGLVQLW